MLKNGSKLPKPDKPENSKNFTQRRRKVAIKIERLQEQIEGSRPHGRDLTAEQWLEALVAAATTFIVSSSRYSFVAIYFDVGDGLKEGFAGDKGDKGDKSQSILTLEMD